MYAATELRDSDERTCTHLGGSLEFCSVLPEAPQWEEEVRK